MFDGIFHPFETMLCFQLSFGKALKILILVFDQAKSQSAQRGDSRHHHQNKMIPFVFWQFAEVHCRVFSCIRHSSVKSTHGLPTEPAVGINSGGERFFKFTSLVLPNSERKYG